MENKVKRRKHAKYSSTTYQNRPNAVTYQPNVFEKFFRSSDVNRISAVTKVVACTLAVYFLYNFVLRFDSKRWLKVESAFDPFNKTFPVDPIFDDAHWSSLASGHYFGLKSARPNSTIVSMMWFRNQIEDDTIKIRHWCNDHDHLDQYIWTFNDLHTAGHQIIVDRNLNINTSYIRVNEQLLKAKITINDVDKSEHRVATSIMLYVAAESFDDRIELLPPSNDATQDKLLKIKVDSKTSGRYDVSFRVTKGRPLVYSHFVSNSTLDAFNKVVLNNMFIYNKLGKRYFILKNTNDKLIQYNANFVAYQVLFEDLVEIELDMVFNPASDSVAKMPAYQYEEELSIKEKEFVGKFDDKFPLENMTADKVKFARHVLSNMIGGISYFYGHSLVRSPKMAKAMRYGPVQLLTAVPSRPFFPRGFLWDEGFHQLIISRWDPNLSMKIIQSWLGLMNKDGWMPREVILDDESRARVPNEYLVQHTNFANPPSLFLAIEALLDANETSDGWLELIYPRLHTWFTFFNSTQTGKYMTTFRWQGRNSTTQLELNPKTMSSGLDDYPRASHPSHDELHLDLRCWMALATRVMAKIGQRLTKPDAEKFESFYQILKDNTMMETRHWSDEHKMFCDFGLHSDNVTLVEVKIGETYDGKAVTATKRKVIAQPKHQCVHEFGYVSLFPFIMTLIEPNNEKLGKVLADLEDPNRLWTPYGLRSLAKTSSYYNRYNTRHDPPYWRGSIWININFMVLKGLDHYRRIVGPYQATADRLYIALRGNLIENMHKEFERTGYVWEQYSDVDGRGKGTRPFTGWSALIINIMSETY